jgi:nucleotide-binding universal stress UspA family protein
MFAERYSAAVRILHAWEVPTYVRPDLTVWSGQLSSTLSDSVKLAAEQAMKEFVQSAEVAGRKDVTTEIVEGPPYAMILSALEAGTYDLVIMGTHGRTGLSHFVLGSVAEKVVRHSGQPVLTVRAPKSQGGEP